MKQHDLINSFTKILVENQYINCAFLMGSYARGSEDEFSNIDFYFLLNVNKREDFFKNYYKIIAKYGKIIYHKNFLNKEIKVIYEDDCVNLCLNLSVNIHIIDSNNIHITNDILPLYDNCHFLENIDTNLAYTCKDIGKMIDDVAIYALDFNRFYMRRDLAIMLDIAHKIENNYVCIVRYYRDKNSSKLVRKEFLSILTKEERIRYTNILKKLKYDTLVECVNLMLEDISNILVNLDLNVVNEFDYDFFIYVCKVLKKTKN